MPDEPVIVMCGGSSARHARIVPPLDFAKSRGDVAVQLGHDDDAGLQWIRRRLRRDRDLVDANAATATCRTRAESKTRAGRDSTGRTTR